MNLRKLVRNFFGFSRQESNGFLVLLPIMLVILFSEPVYRSWISREAGTSTADKALLDSLISDWQTQQIKHPVTTPTRQKRRFNFDPNTVSSDELIELGFSGRLATRIQKYRAKGRNFKVKKDLLKLYGMDSSLYQELEPYVLLPDSLIREKRKYAGTKSDQILQPIRVRFDINTADTSELKKIYGIGEKLSVRIFKYRESLGGFIRSEQLSEVYGLDSAVVNTLINKSFIAPDFQPKQLNLNQATEEELERHPYLTKKEAKAIIAYRFQHGAFTTVDDLQKIQLLTAGTIEKIKPYLILN